MRSFSVWTEDGEKLTGEEGIKSHSLGEKKVIPSNFFAQKLAENVSGVIFSNQLTVSKFKRMAYQMGYYPKGMKVIRTGIYLSPSQAEPIPFKYVLGTKEAVEETWCQGLSFIVNPGAEEPVPPLYFGKITSHIYWEGELRSHVQDFHPLNNQTIFLMSK